MDIEMRPAQPAQGESSGQALEPSAVASTSETSPPPGMDPEVLGFARTMFVGGPGWPVLPPRQCTTMDPTNLQLRVAADVVDFLFRYEKARFEVTDGVWLQQSEARGYLLAAQCGRGLLPNAQAAHDIGSKAAKQAAEAAKEAKRTAKAARRKVPEAQRDAAAAAACDVVWDTHFTLFQGLSSVKPVPAKDLSLGASWQSGSSYRSVARQSAATTGLLALAAPPARPPLAEIQQPLEPQPPRSPQPGPVCDPSTDEMTRRIRHFPDESPVPAPQSPPQSSPQLPPQSPPQPLEARVSDCLHRLADNLSGLHLGRVQGVVRSEATGQVVFAREMRDMEVTIARLQAEKAALVIENAEAVIEAAGTIDKLRSFAKELLEKNNLLQEALLAKQEEAIDKIAATHFKHIEKLNGVYGPFADDDWCYELSSDEEEEGILV